MAGRHARCLRPAPSAPQRQALPPEPPAQRPAPGTWRGPLSVQLVPSTYSCSSWRYGWIDRSACTCGLAAGREASGWGLGAAVVAMHPGAALLRLLRQRLLRLRAPRPEAGSKDTRWAAALGCRTWQPTPMNSRRFTSRASTVASTWRGGGAG